MSPLSFGLLAILPPAVIIAWRLLRLAPRMDERAIRAFLARALAFLAAAGAASGALYAFKGSLALPAHWSLALAALAGALVLRMLRRLG